MAGFLHPHMCTRLDHAETRSGVGRMEGRPFRMRKYPQTIIEIYDCLRVGDVRADARGRARVHGQEPLGAVPPATGAARRRGPRARSSAVTDMPGKKAETCWERAAGLAAVLHTGAARRTAQNPRSCFRIPKLAFPTHARCPTGPTAVHCCTISHGPMPGHCLENEPAGFSRR